MNQITVATAAFKALSVSSQKRLAKKARIFIAGNPGLATANGFWMALSARQVTEVAQ